MFKMFRFILFIACASSGPFPVRGMVPQMDGRIVGGNTATIQNYPYQVAILMFGGHHCGGSIYTNKIVLTAAHCLQRVRNRYLRVRAGSSFSKSGGILVGVSSFKKHPQYNDDTRAHDIALIYLSTALAFDSIIRNIPLSSMTPANGATAVVTGWGRLRSGGHSPEQLQMATVNVVGQHECASEQYNYGAQIMSGMLCATNEGKDACQGDSGGPLVSNGVLVGVVSWGWGCAEPGFPGVYTDVALYRSWILSNL